VFRLAISSTVFLLAMSAGFAQTSQQSLTMWEIKYFRYILKTLGNPDYSPAFVSDFEKHLVADFTMTPQEKAALDAAGQSYRTFLLSARQTEASVRAGKATLTAGDGATLQGLYAQEGQTVTSLAAQVMNAVRPETATRLAAAANVMTKFPAFGGN
jgi:hypothetical protein